MLLRHFLEYAKDASFLLLDVLIVLTLLIVPHYLVAATICKRIRYLSLAMFPFLDAIFAMLMLR